MYHPSGKFVVPIMHELARKNRKKEALFDPSQPGTSTSGSPAQQEEDRSAPSELACSICKCLLRDAVLAICCGDSFCADCIQQKVLEDPLQKCPGSGCLQISTDSLVPNNKMRLAVQKFLSNQYSKTDSAPTVGASSGLLHKLLPDLVASSTASAPTQPSSSTIATTTAAGSITLSEQKPPAGAPPSSKVHQPSIQSSTVSSHHHQAPPKRAPASSSVPPPTSTVPASLGVAAKPLPFPVNLSVPPPPIPSRVVPSATFPSMTRPPPQSQMGIPIPHQQSSTFPPASAPSMAATRGAIPLHLGTAPQQQQQQHQRDHQGINDAWDAFVRRKDEVGPRKACELAFLSDIQDKLRKQTSLHPPGAESPKNSPSSGSSRTSSSTPPRPRHHHHSRHHPYASGRRDSRRGHSPSPPQQYRRQYHHGGRGVGGLRRGGRTLPSRMPPSSRRLSPSPSRSARKNEPPSQPESAVAINIHGQSELMPPGIALSPTTTKESKRRLGRGHARRRSKSPDERREVSPPPKLDVSEERSRDRTSSKRERHQSGSKFDKGTVAAKDPKVDRAKRREKRDKAKRNVKEGESAEGKNNEKASPPSNIKDSSPPPPIQAGGTRKRKKHLDVLQDGGDQKPAKVLKHRRHSKRAGKSHEEQGEKKEVAQVAEVDVNVKDIAQEPLKKEREKHIAEKGAGESLTSTTETRVAAADERKLTMESLDSEGADTIHGSSASQMAGECGPRLPPISTTTSDKAEETGGTKPTAPVDYPVTKWKPLPEVRDGDLDRIEGRETSAIIVKETSQMKEGEHPPKEKAPSPTSTSTTMAAARTKKITKNTDDELASRMGVINQLDSRPSLDDGDAEGQKEKSLHRSHKKKKASKHRRKHRREHRKSSEESGHRSREHSHHRRSKSGERKKREDGPRKKSKSKSLGGDRDRDEHSEEQKYTARKERRSHDEKRQRKKKHSSRREQQHSRHHRSSKHCTSREGEVSDGDERKNQDVKGELTEKARPQRDTNPDTDFRSLHRRQIDSAESSQRDVTGVKGPSRKNSTAEATSRARSVPQQIVVTIPSI